MHPKVVSMMSHQEIGSDRIPALFVRAVSVSKDAFQCTGCGIVFEVSVGPMRCFGHRCACGKMLYPAREWKPIPIDGVDTNWVPKPPKIRRKGAGRHGRTKTLEYVRKEVESFGDEEFSTHDAAIKCAMSAYSVSNYLRMLGYKVVRQRYNHQRGVLGSATWRKKGKDRAT